MTNDSSDTESLPKPERTLYGEFVRAIMSGDVEAVKDCIARGVDIQLSHVDDFTPLGYAAGEGYLEVVQVLLDAGAKVNVRQLCEGLTPLMCAVGGGNLDIVKALVEAGAKVNVQSYQGDTAESNAQYGDHDEILEYLQPFISEEEEEIE